MQLLMSRINTWKTKLSLKDSSSFVVIPANIQNIAYIYIIISKSAIIKARAEIK